MGRTALSTIKKRREAEYAKKLLTAQQIIEQYGKVQGGRVGRNGFMQSQKAR
jgi:hypothetical protein